MLAVVSPAKKMDFDRDNLPDTFTRLTFEADAAALLETAKTLTADDLKRLMKISDDLGQLNFQRFQAMGFPFTPDNAKQAIFAFNGDTYAGFDVKTLAADDLTYAQDHVRILSGLYGLLRPLDLIQPYRLEMGTRLANPRGENLYDFWGTLLADELNRELSAHSSPVLVNCASNEYFKAVSKKALNVPVVTPVFKEIKGGAAKVIGFSAKRARGMMARYLCETRVDRPEGLKDFTSAGYAFQPDQSSETEFVFTRVID
ncbi:peroxide stress protein YaaA [Sneathiella chinensis]|uniref:UPF0246 protein GCM10007924_05100 n=1 Tax=Sneathiella chinensis TaxID=349750 RepID=A0ABQ5U1Y6_9PROT|nr:peroxide stress protein YaaA [Sneathiella chinensis]GLQ05289.1 UPF0246 protein [Sneathiella chinensis]